jgi:hypothetical protein
MEIIAEKLPEGFDSSASQARPKDWSIKNVRFDPVSDFYNLAKSVVAQFSECGLVLYLDEWGIWSASENWDLFDSLCIYHFGRTHIGETTRYDASERATAVTFLQIALQFGWGGLLKADDGEWFRFDHDGFAVLCCRRALQDTWNITGVSVE